MLNTQTLVEAYLQSAVVSRGASKSHWLWRLLLRVFAYALIPAGLAWGAWHLWYGWQTADWGAAEHAQLLTLQALVTSWWLLGHLRVTRASARTRMAVEIFRQALATRDEQLMPMVATQPAPPIGAATPMGSDRIGPIQTLVSLLAMGRALVVGGWVLLLLFTATDIGKDLPAGAAHDAVRIQWIVLGFTLLTLVVGFIWLYWRARMTVHADEIGVRWRVAGRTQAIEWARARGFCQVTLRPYSVDRDVTTYLLDTPEDVLAWVANGAGRQARWTAWHDRSERLASLVAARTRLPLRDASALAKRLSEDEADLPRLAREVGRPDLTTATPKSPHWGWGRVGCLMLLAAVLVPLASAYGLSFYQSRYFSSLPARLHAEAPRFADPLSAPTGAWSIEAPSAGDASSAQYVDGSYQLHGTADRTQWALSPGAFGDVAVEVMARHLADTGEYSAQGVGLALRANAATSEAVYFWVTPWGEADLWLYRPQGHDNPDEDWQQLAQQSDAAIHKGVDTWNRLMVVMRGGLYLCYVNDTLVITYYDQAHDVTADPTPHAGQMGVYVNDGAVGGAFRDFAVYPVQPPSSFWYV